MPDALVYIPHDDVQSYVARAFRLALIDCSELVIPCSGFTQQLTGAAELQFPEIGVDWRSVNITGISGDWHPVTFIPSGMTATAHFATPQTGDVTVSDYKRLSTYPVGKVDDLTFDLFTYFGDPDASLKKERKIPIAIPCVDLPNTVRRFASGCEMVELSGSLVIYAGASQGSIANLRAEAAKIHRYLRANRTRFTQQGLVALQVELPRYQTYKNTLYEAEIPFSCTATLSPNK